ncbi:hypothetical protein ACGFYM_13910 [Streptomyces sp. NPDC048231]|uniref:hypothetical protein n=1 Tax=Streptomyces sp. NPDC048231 TaxID=3365519 RepID=UPI00371C3DB3
MSNGMSEGMDGPAVGPAGIRLGVVRGISYGMFGAPDSFVPETRGLGAGLTRVHVYWSQVEPEPGRFDWTVVDAILGQLDPAVETWVTVCSSSPWATRHHSDFLPSSPAEDLEQYERFVKALVSRCRGRVDYWQCNNEPSNTGLLWAGTAPEYVEHLTVFHRAVRSCDPGSAVVLGGCGYDVLSSPPDSEARRFFDHLVEHGRDAFDLFSVHLYGDPRAIPEQVETVRRMMRRHGYERPVVAGEYNGPTLFEFPEAQGVFEQTMMAAFTDAGSGAAVRADTGERADDSAGPGAAEPADRRTMRALYARMPDLPPQLQMFLEGCSPELAAKRDRINQRQIVTRNVLALASGITRTACWNLAPEIPDYSDRFNLMGFLFGKLALMDYEDRRMTGRRPAADTFALLAGHLRGATAVRSLDGADDGRTVCAFEVIRRGRGPLHILWADGDVFSGEDRPPAPVDWPWPHPTAQAVDAFGEQQSVQHGAGTVHLDLTVTPVFLSSGLQS